jgi:hypothetical protein
MLSIREANFRLVSRSQSQREVWSTGLPSQSGRPAGSTGKAYPKSFRRPIWKLFLNNTTLTVGLVLIVTGLMLFLLILLSNPPRHARTQYASPAFHLPTHKSSATPTPLSRNPRHTFEPAGKFAGEKQPALNSFSQSKSAPLRATFALISKLSRASSPARRAAFARTVWSAPTL